MFMNMSNLKKQLQFYGSYKKIMGSANLSFKKNFNL